MSHLFYTGLIVLLVRRNHKNLLGDLILKKKSLLLTVQALLVVMLAYILLVWVGKFQFLITYPELGQKKVLTGNQKLN